MPPAARPPSSRARATRVLCVEDEAVLRRTLVRLLEVLGYSATGVATAEEALVALGDEPFDVVVTDLRLPAMSGEWLVEQISLEFPSLRGRCITMSGQYPETDSTNIFLQKPFTAEDLQGALALARTRGERGKA